MFPEFNHLLKRSDRANLADEQFNECMVDLAPYKLLTGLTEVEITTLATRQWMQEMDTTYAPALQPLRKIREACTARVEQNLKDYASTRKSFD